jgi:hypothetical protein
MVQIDQHDACVSRRFLAVLQQQLDLFNEMLTVEDAGQAVTPRAS